MTGLVQDFIARLALTPVVDGELDTLDLFTIGAKSKLVPALRVLDQAADQVSVR